MQDMFETFSESVEAQLDLLQEFFVKNPELGDSCRVLLNRTTRMIRYAQLQEIKSRKYPLVFCRKENRMIVKAAKELLRQIKKGQGKYPTM